MILQVNPSIGGPTVQQTAIAGLLLAGILVVALIIATRLRFAGLSDERRKTLAAVRGGLTTQRPGSVRISSPDAISSRRADIRATFDASGAVEDTPTMRGAAGAVVDAVAESYRPLANRLPPRARRLVGLAVLVLVFGALAVSTDLILRFLRADGSINAQAWVDVALADSWSVLVEFLSLPGIKAIYALLTASGILLGQWAYEHYYAVALCLVVAAGVLAALSRYRDLGDRPDRTLPQPGRVAALTAGTVGVGWGVVLVAIGLGRSLGPAEQGVTYGLYAAAGAAIVGAIALLILSWRGLVAARQARVELDDPPGVAVTTARVFGLLLTALSVVLLPVWVVFAVLALPRIITAWLAATLAIKALTLLLVGLVLFGLLLAARSATTSIRDAVAERASRRAVAWAVGARAMPAGAVVIATGALLSFNAGIIISVLGGITVGLVARQLFKLLERARYSASMRESGPTGAARVVVHGYRIDEGGGPWYFARVNGELVADSDPDRLLRAVEDAARDCFATGEVQPTVAGQRAADLRDHGIRDREETVSRIREHVVREIEGRTAKEQPVDPDDIREQLEGDYPAPIWQEIMAALPHSQHSPVHRRRGLLYYG